jgi:hypothetical protein
MKLVRYIKLLMLVFTAFPGMMIHAQSTVLTVISNPTGAPMELKEAELKSILRGERQRWKNDKKIVIAMMKTNTVAGKDICERLYDMSPDELKKFWLALVFQGKADAPVFFTSSTELHHFVAETPGAIGILDQVPAAPGTQVVFIDGKKTF